MNTKWNWQTEWEGKIYCARGMPDGTSKEYIQSQCRPFEGVRVTVGERFEFGKFSVRLEMENPPNYAYRWRDITEVVIPRVRTLKSAQRKAPFILREKLVEILERKSNKYLTLIKNLDNSLT